MSPSVPDPEKGGGERDRADEREIPVLPPAHPGQDERGSEHGAERIGHHHAIWCDVVQIERRSAGVA